jgi:hypothetical protein
VDWVRGKGEVGEENIVRLEVTAVVGLFSENNLSALDCELQRLPSNFGLCCKVVRAKGRAL